MEGNKDEEDRWKLGSQVWSYQFHIDKLSIAENIQALHYKSSNTKEKEVFVIAKKDQIDSVDRHKSECEILKSDARA